MKNNKKFLMAMLGKAMVIAVLVLGLVLAGCTTDDGGEEETRSNPVLGETFDISEKIYGESSNDVGFSYTPLTNVTAVTVEGPFSTAPTATVTAGGNFTVPIPAADASRLITATETDLADMFDFSSGANITTLQPTDAKFGELRFFVTTPEYYAPLYLNIRSASRTEDNYSESGTRYLYVYVDKDVTIKGSEQEQGEDWDNPEDKDDSSVRVYDHSTIVSLSLKAGWNVVEQSFSYSEKKISDTKSESKNTETYSVKGIRESAKWAFDARASWY